MQYEERWSIQAYNFKDFEGGFSFKSIINMALDGFSRWLG